VIKMSRVFAYCRVSTDNQTTANQVLEIKTAGFAIESHRVIEEIISGSVAAKERPQFSKLLERLEANDVLVVTKLDRLGRNAMDVRSTVDELAANGIRVHCLVLGGVDLTSAAGRMTMQVLAAVAEFERDLLIERTQAGLARAKASGKQLGRPVAVATRALVQELKEQKFSQSQVAAKLGLGIATVKRHWNV
jgi:putative DNA-invertase from lambdoid prophage Rac